MHVCRSEGDTQVVGHKGDKATLPTMSQVFTHRYPRSRSIATSLGRRTVAVNRRCRNRRIGEFLKVTLDHLLDCACQPQGLALYRRLCRYL